MNNEHNEVKRAGQQEGFIVGCIVSSLVWFVFVL